MAIDDLTLEGRAKNLPDLQLTNLWQLIVPGIKTVAPKNCLNNEEDLTIRCRSISIPQKVINTIESKFQGSTQQFPTTPVVHGSVNATYEDTSDMRAFKIITEYMNNIYSTNFDDPIMGGKSLFPYKRAFTRDLYLYFNKYDGTFSDKAIRFHNAFPTTIAEVSLSYDTASAVTYSVSFSYDFWTIFPKD
jgi:hypothetical protein